MTPKEIILGFPPNYQSNFQKQLGVLVANERPGVVVESGVQTGDSTVHILNAMDAVGKGRLFSIEPYTNPDIQHPRWTMVRGFSADKMPEIYKTEWQWNMFIHDSDHAVGCATFEYELAWRMLQPGGILVSDDYTWGTPSHLAWQKFLARHKNLGIYQLGSAQFTIKPKDESYLHYRELDQAIIDAYAMADKACIEYGKKPYSTHRNDEDYLLNLG